VSSHVDHTSHLLGSSGEQDLLNVVRNFRAWCERELGMAHQFLSAQQHSRLRNYVRSRQLLEYTPARKRWLDRGYSQQVDWVIQRIRASDVPLRILDAGCGLGTECILFAALGAQVVGVDLWAENLAIAKQRVAYWQRVHSLAPNITFEHVNLLTYTPREAFDLVYAREAISHIDSLNDFLTACAKYLVPAGDVVICDSNAWNPYIQWTLWRLRGTRLDTLVSDPVTGESIPYAIERVFSPRDVCARLRRHGFTIVSQHASGFVPISFVTDRTERWLRALCDGLEMWPPAASLGARYIIVGRKGELPDDR
jgi:2-polyprenyl-3-methyl-5-hydroxy-6-metoxy-1,4-benzoquinol methylase